MFGTCEPMWKWTRRSDWVSLAARSFSQAKRISAVLRPNLALSPVEEDHLPSQRLHADLFGDADDVVEFGELLDHDDDLFAQLAAEERDADEIVVLVAVANDERVGALVHGHGDHELGFGAGLEAVVEALGRGDDLLDHFAELVDLDGEHAAVAALVALVLDRLVEDAVELFDAVAEQVLETDDERGLQAHGNGLVHDIHDADGATVGKRLHGHAAVLGDAEVARAPALEAVKLLGLGGGPGG
jgi:hypothetical protein